MNETILVALAATYILRILVFRACPAVHLQPHAFHWGKSNSEGFDRGWDGGALHRTRWCLWCSYFILPWEQWKYSRGPVQTIWNAYHTPSRNYTNPNEAGCHVSENVPRHFCLRLWFISLISPFSTDGDRTWFSWSNHLTLQKISFEQWSKPRLFGLCNGLYYPVL